jgi:NADH-quinone oxidoreductase subunit G
MFFEPSTRTRGSFELAEKRLSCDTMNMGGSTSSTVKGESLKDTILTLNAMKVDCYVVRSSHAGAPYQVAKYTDACVIDAGDGKHQHPTQALLDLYTIWEHKQDFNGLKVAIVGDVGHSRVCGSLVPALKIMGADEVYDTIFSADLTIWEEAEEFKARLASGENLPLFTSCCPAWVKFVENEYPEFLKNLSTARSPMQMLGSVLKDRYKEKDAADGRTTYHIAIMPCTAKKMEAGREEFTKDGVPDVDLVLTTQEVIKMIKESGIRFQMLEKEAPDLPFGMGSGAAEIFGSTGGVAEAVLRYCIPDNSKNALRIIEHSGVRGNDPIRIATVQVGDREVRVGVVHGLSNARKLLEQIKAGEVQVDIVEVMTCRTGCVGGAGQPYALMGKKLQRASGLYEIDRGSLFKRPQRNPVIASMYENGLREKAHELLHVHYGHHEE